MCRTHILLSAFLCVFVMLFANPAKAQTAGTMRYNDISSQMEFFDGSQWFNFGIELGLDLGGCSKAGEMEYDPLLLLGSYKYCNGAIWIRIVTIPVSLHFCVGTQAGTIDYDAGRKTFLMCNGVAWASMKGSAATT
jgi:hypothetical protein